MGWFVYSVEPIDFRWERLQTVTNVAAALAAEKASQRAAHGGAVGLELDADDFLNNWELAKELAGAKGWEGDFRHPSVVFWVPSECEFSYGFAFKQDNNGTTFVVSPVPLPHLER